MMKPLFLHQYCSETCPLPKRAASPSAIANDVDEWSLSKPSLRPPLLHLGHSKKDNACLNSPKPDFKYTFRDKRV